MSESNTFRGKAHETLNELFENIEQLKASAEKVSVAHRIKFADSMEELTAKKRDLLARYERLLATTDEGTADAWKKLDAAKNELDQAWRKIKLDYDL